MDEAGDVPSSQEQADENRFALRKSPHSWTAEEVDARLKGIMKGIHKSCLDAAATYAKPGDYVAGANIAGFLKVARAMLAYGVV